MRITTTYTPSVLIIVGWKKRTTAELEFQFLYVWPTLQYDTHSSTQSCQFSYSAYLPTLIPTSMGCSFKNYCTYREHTQSKYLW
jgi:hypothetical protein